MAPWDKGVLFGAFIELRDDVIALLSLEEGYNAVHGVPQLAPVIGRP